jgi:hypothetical protein
MVAGQGEPYHPRSLGLRDPPTRRSGSIAVAGFPKLGSAFAASSFGVAEAGTGQLARIVEREPSPTVAGVRGSEYQITSL